MITSPTASYALANAALLSGLRPAGYAGTPGEQREKGERS